MKRYGTGVQIRRHQPGEERAIWEVLYASMHQIVAREYTSEQVARWAPDEYDGTAWRRRLAGQAIFVAELDGQIVGFATLADYDVDFFYGHPNHQRRGIGRALMVAVFEEAVRLGASSLTASVSTTAVSFFRAMGFVAAEETNQIICGVPAKQYQMVVRIPNAGSTLER